MTECADNYNTDVTINYLHIKTYLNKLFTIPLYSKYSKDIDLHLEIPTYLCSHKFHIGFYKKGVHHMRANDT